MSLKTFSAGERLFASDLNDNFGALNVDADNIDAANITSGKIDSGRLPVRKVEHFRNNGTWTPPSGVTSAVAYVRGGGGGVGRSTGGTGGTTTVAFSSGSISALGGNGQSTDLGGNHYSFNVATRTGAANSGAGARYTGHDGNSGVPLTLGGPAGRDGAFIIGPGITSPGVGVAVTIGAGGGAGTGGAGGASGYAYIEYYQ